MKLILFFNNKLPKKHSENYSFDDKTLQKSYRCNSDICIVANQVYGDKFSPMESEGDEYDMHKGVFLVKEDDIDNYLLEYKPMQLRYNKKTKAVRKEYKAINIGKSKGLSFDRVLIYPTEIFKNWILRKEIIGAVHGEDDARNVKKTLSKIGHGRFSGRYIKDLNNPQPQAMMKIFNRRPRGASVRLLMEYIARVRDVDIEKDEPPLEMHLSDGTVIQGSEKVKELFKDWEMDFEYGTLGSGEKKHRHATHIMFSADTEFKNHKEVLASAKATAHLLWGRSGYEYGLSMHLDGTKPHVHIVLKDRNRITGKIGGCRTKIISFVCYINVVCYFPPQRVNRLSGNLFPISQMFDWEFRVTLHLMILL